MKKVRALLVDDNERFLDSIERYLVSIPELSIVCAAKATSGEEAIKLCAQLKPDLVLMDLTMPGMGGLKATRLIKQETQAPRVVILTIHESSEYRNAAREAGADSFLTKSEFTEKLVSVVQSMFPQSSNAVDVHVDKRKGPTLCDHTLFGSIRRICFNLWECKENEN